MLCACCVWKSSCDKFTLLTQCLKSFYLFKLKLKWWIQFLYFFIKSDELMERYVQQKWKFYFMPCYITQWRWKIFFYYISFKNNNETTTTKFQNRVVVRNAIWLEIVLGYGNWVAFKKTIPLALRKVLLEYGLLSNIWITATLGNLAEMQSQAKPRTSELDFLWMGPSNLWVNNLSR